MDKTDTLATTDCTALVPGVPVTMWQLNAGYNVGMWLCDQVSGQVLILLPHITSNK